MQLEAIERINIKWQVDEAILLRISLSNSGAISRAGDGESNKLASRMYMGRIETETFVSLMAQFDSKWIEEAGRYTMPPAAGQECILTLSFEDEEQELGIEFTYQTEGHGPPEDLIEFVELALSLSDPWYGEMLEKHPKN